MSRRPLRSVMPPQGPARCREALMQVLALRRIPGIWPSLPMCWSALPAATAGPSAFRALTEDELARYGRSRAVQGISAGDALRFCASCRRTLRFRPSALRRPVQPHGIAFFRQNAELLPTTLPDALRGVSSLLLTDLTALDYDALGRHAGISG